MVRGGTEIVGAGILDLVFPYVTNWLLPGKSISEWLKAIPKYLIDDVSGAASDEPI